MKLFRKTYGVYGMVEWSTLVNAGDSNIRIDFINGSISTRGIDPAVFTTDNLAIQTAVESSDKYRKGRIKLVNKYQIGETVDTPASEDKKDIGHNTDNDQSDDLDNNREEDDGENMGTEGKISYPDVKNSQMAKDILMGEPYNVLVSDMPNKTAILEIAAKQNVVFPNWK